MSEIKVVPYQRSAEPGSNAIGIEEASEMLSRAWLRVWGDCDPNRIRNAANCWGESIVCTKCHYGDFDAPSAAMHIFLEDGTLRDPRELFEELASYERNNICEDPCAHEDNIDFFWSQERTRQYLEMQKDQDLLLAVEESLNEGEINRNLIGWFRGFDIFQEELSLSEEDSESLSANGGVYYIDTLGYDADVRGDKRLAVLRKLAPHAMRLILSKYYFQDKDIVFRTHANASHVVKFGEHWANVDFVGYSVANPNRLYYQIEPSFRKAIPYYLKSLVKPLFNPFRSLAKSSLIRALIEPEKVVEPLLIKFANSAIYNGDQEGQLIGMEALKYIQESDEVKESLKNSARDLKVSAAIVLGTFSLYGIIAPLALISRNPVLLALLSFEATTMALPVVGGVSGILRSIYLTSRAINYSMKYRYPLAPRIVISLISALDLGWMLSPLIALRDSNGSLRRLAVWAAKSKFKRKKSAENKVNLEVQENDYDSQTRSSHSDLNLFK